MNLDKIYKERFQHKDDVKSLGWGSEFSQTKRFEILLEINGYRKGDSVLDVGCGYGDLSVYIDNYTGIDIRSYAIQKAKEKYKDCNFLNCDIFSLSESYDWVFASGIFCFNKRWKKYTEEHINKMYSISKKGTAFNFISYRSDNRIKGIKYAKISETISIVSEINSKFSIRNDYLNNDFTVYLYK
jgi:ubiquinone/menaquinone biosynthesis C-methylase UbiE